MPQVFNDLNWPPPEGAAVPGFATALRFYGAPSSPEYCLRGRKFSEIQADGLFIFPLATAGCPIGPLERGPTNLLPTAEIAFRNEIPAFGNDAYACPIRSEGGDLGVRIWTCVGRSLR